MDLNTKEFLLYRIFSSITTIDIHGINYIIKHPTRMDRYKAQQVYNNITIGIQKEAFRGS